MKKHFGDNYILWEVENGVLTLHWDGARTPTKYIFVPSGVDSTFDCGRMFSIGLLLHGSHAWDTRGTSLESVRGGYYIMVLVKSFIFDPDEVSFHTFTVGPHS